MSSPFNAQPNCTTYVKTHKELGINIDNHGIYVNSSDSRLEVAKLTGNLEFGLGDAPGGTIANRQLSLTSSKYPLWQNHILDAIPDPGYRDHQLHKLVRENFAVQLRDPNKKGKGTRSELFRVQIDAAIHAAWLESNDFEPVRQWLSDNIRNQAGKLNSSHRKQRVDLRDTQKHVIKLIKSILRSNGCNVNFIAELAPRLGKTILFLELYNQITKLHPYEAMFIMAYGTGLSVKTSYANEIAKFSNFKNMVFIDAAEYGAKKAYYEALAANKKPVVFISLNPDATTKHTWLHNIKNPIMALLEETDFGTHTDSQVDKIDYLLEKKSEVTRINASGTNMSKIAKAMGKNAIDEVISIPYSMIEQDTSIEDVVWRRFYNMLFDNSMNSLLEEFDEDVLPNLTKILSKPNAQSRFIKALFQDLFGYQPIYGLNLSDQAGEELLHTMLFVNISNKAMNQLKKVIEDACPEHKVLILNGDHTNNKDAEGLTKEELVKLANNHYEGRDKLLVITNMMGTRSYSIPEIQACLFMQDGGDIYPFMQKYSRCLTPGNEKDYGHIFDFSFDPNKTRNTTMAIFIEAAVLAQKTKKPIPECVRMVLNSASLKDVLMGEWLDADAIIKASEDSNKLLEVANANTHFSIEDLTDDERADFGEVAKNAAKNKAERNKVEKVINTGKTRPGNVSPRSKKNTEELLLAVIQKAIKSLNASAATVSAISNFEGTTFLECIDIIMNSKQMINEFSELFGFSPDLVLRLSDRLPINILNIIVHNSINGDSTKHIVNNNLAVLKDDPDQWIKLLSQRTFRRQIKSNKCKNILIVAGGHGTEIDILVELYGDKIIEKVTFIDKYSYFCNLIHRKYPNIKNVIHGDFLSWDFKNMKFDNIIGNPPYKKATQNNGAGHGLWNLFVDKAIDLLKDDGWMAMVHPAGWRNIEGSFDEIKQKIWQYDIHYLEIHNISDGLKTFRAATRYDVYIMQKSSTVDLKTRIIDETGQQVDINIKDIPFIPNFMINEILGMLCGPNDEPTSLIGNRSMYGTDKSNMSAAKDKNFKYPCVKYIPKGDNDDINLLYSNTKKEMFVPKVMFGIGSQVGKITVDHDGKYGMCQFVFGLVDAPENLDKIRKCLDSANMQQIMQAVQFTTQAYNYKFLARLPKDFWQWI